VFRFEVKTAVTRNLNCFVTFAEKPTVHRSTEVYNLQTGKWILRKAELPYQLNLGKLGILSGLPTFVGGYNEDDQVTSKSLYQYHWDQDEWVLYPSRELNFPRYNFAMFEVPQNLLGNCFT